MTESREKKKFLFTQEEMIKYRQHFDDDLCISGFSVEWFSVSVYVCAGYIIYTDF